MKECNIKKLFFYQIVFLFVLVISAHTVHAQTLCDDNAGFVPKVAPTFSISSNMGHRNTGIPGASTVHRGTDSFTPCGTEIQGPPKGCVQVEKTRINGYGNVLQFNCGNGIKMQYAHLQNSSYNAASNIITTGDTGVGACHLDYIVTLDNKVVDPQCSTGTVTGEYTYGNSSDHHNAKCPFSGAVNLCDAAVRNALKNHAQQVFKGSDKDTYIIGDGPTIPGSGDGDHDADPDDDAGHDHQEDSPGDVVNQGNDGKDGTGGVDGKDDLLEEEGKDPEEEEPEEPEPAEEYDPKASTPICDNSTCITQDIIDNAKHLRVDVDKVDTHLEYLTAEGKCKEPIETGITVLRQKPGKIVEYPDAFCTNVGCTYQNDGSGKGKCE